MKLIAVVDEHWGLGRAGKLLFRLPPDLKRFKALTMGGILVMGRKTLLSLPGGVPLQGRKNIVLTKGAALPEGAIPCGSLSRLFQMLEEPPLLGLPVFVAGGAAVYAELLPYCEEALITRVYANGNGDCFFPNLDQLTQWHAGDVGPVEDYKGLRYTYVTYQNHCVVSSLPNFDDNCYNT